MQAAEITPLGSDRMVASAAGWTCPGQATSPLEIAPTCGDLDPHLIRFLGPTQVHIPNSFLTGSAFFCTAHGRKSLYFTMGHLFLPPSKLSLVWGI